MDMHVEIYSIPQDPQEAAVWNARRAGTCPQCNGPLAHGKLYLMSDGNTVHKKCARAYAARTGTTHPGL